MLLNNLPRHEHCIQFNNALFKVYTVVNVLIEEEFVEYRRMFNKIQIIPRCICNSQSTAFVNCNFSILIHRKSLEKKMVSFKSTHMLWVTPFKDKLLPLYSFLPDCPHDRQLTPKSTPYKKQLQREWIFYLFLFNYCSEPGNVTGVFENYILLSLSLSVEIFSALPLSF